MRPEDAAREVLEGGSNAFAVSRANAPRRSHQELDESTDLAAGNPAELGAAYVQLRERLPGS